MTVSTSSVTGWWSWAGKGFRLMLLCGLGGGLIVGGWLGFGPALFGEPVWFPFDTDRLVHDLRFRSAGAPVAFEGVGVLYWLVLALLPPGLFLFVFRQLRQEDVLLAREVLIQERRAEHVERARQAEQLWEAFERAELADDLDEQMRCLDGYQEAAELVELSSDVHRDRVQRCRALAQRLGDQKPQLALRVLKHAQQLRQTGKGQGAGLWPLIRGDVLGYLVGLGAVVTGIPLAVLVVLGAVGVLMWVFKILVGAIILLAVLGFIFNR